MITPPLSVKSFYSVLLECPAANELMKLIAPVCGTDVDHAIVTSVDMDSDIAAVNELTVGISALTNQLECSQTLAFNPVYLPMKAKELEQHLNFNGDGDLESIAGFDNPYISARLTLNVHGDKVVDGKIAFKQFPFPPLFELLRCEEASSS